MDAPQPKRRRVRLWQALLLALLLLLCVGSISAFVLADQTTMVGVLYLQAVNAGNDTAAQLLGDHFSDDQGWHQRFFEQDIRRDIGYLNGATLSGVTASREQTLSGQWVTMLRFNYRAPDSTAWSQAALRVKT